jgi:serine/threonine protein kinase
MQIIIAGLKSFFEKVSNHPEIFSKFATAVLENIQNMKRENFALISLRNSLREFTLCVFIRADLLDEIAFMKKLGCHKHLVNMIGCVSNPANPLIITELCALGDLLKLLHRSKTKMRNVIQFSAFFHLFIIGLSKSYQTSLTASG